MKQFDFNKGFITESKQEPEIITEFFGTILLCGALAFMCSGSIFDMFSKIEKSRSEYLKNNAEKEKNKAAVEKARRERQQEKEDEKKEKEQAELKEQTQKTARQMMAFENAINSMEDGPEKDAAKKQYDSMKKVMSGDASMKELKEIEKLAKEPQPEKIQKFIERVGVRTGNMPDSAVEKWMKANNISAENTITGLTTVADETIQQQQETEDKTDDELKQELKDKYSAEGAEVPEEYQNKDTKKFDPATIDALSGDALKQAATTAGIEITKPKAKPTKPVDEEEDKTDDELKQELKDALKDKSGDEVPEALRGDDGKFSEEKLNAMKGDDLKQAATTAGIKTTKPKQGKPKPAEEKDEYTYLDKDDKEVVVKREKQEDGTYKYTKTIEGGEPTEASEDDFNKAKEEEGEDNTDDDERTDNDDDLEDEDTTGAKQDPHKVWKRRTYKRGNKTFKTKSYYDKKGNSISAKDFKEKVRKFNESYRGWRMTPLASIRKPANITEAKDATDMVTICKERLVYIKFVMDTTTNNVEKVKMERMYNAIYNCCFDTNGKPRSLTDLYTYLNETMIENKGKIPGLPNNDQILNIDDKLKAWRKTSPDKFDAYMARLDKENLDKAGTKKSDKAKDLLSPDHSDDDTKAMDKIRELSDVYGFTNILGLEPTRQASKADDSKKDEIKKQQKDGSPTTNAKDSKDVNPEDVSDEQIDKIIGVK